jgi:hypothetical protein
MPGPLDKEIINEVEKFLAKEEYNAEGKQLSHRELYKRYKRRKWRYPIGLTKFNEITNKREERLKKPFSWAEWKPWANPEASVEDRGFLLQINAIKQAEIGRGLFKHEAEWAQKLRGALPGLHPYGQYKIVLLYSFREYFAHYSGSAIDTADLDALIAYKPWLPDNQPNYVAYVQAIEAGIATFPELDPFREIREPKPEELDILALPEDPDYAEDPESQRMVMEALRTQLRWILTPHGTAVPGSESNSEKRERLDQLLQFWSEASW